MKRYHRWSMRELNELESLICEHPASTAAKLFHSKYPEIPLSSAATYAASMRRRMYGGSRQYKGPYKSLDFNRISAYPEPLTSATARR